MPPFIPRSRVMGVLFRRTPPTHRLRSTERTTDGGWDDSEDWLRNRVEKTNALCNRKEIGRRKADAFASPVATAAEGPVVLKVKGRTGSGLHDNFWATDCGGCALEIPSFIELQKAYRTKSFTTLGVAMDISYEGLKDSSEAWARVRPFVAKKGINYQIAMGDDAIAKAYGLDAYPATYLIDKSGRIAVAYKGLVVDKDNVETNIKGLLSER